MDKSQARDKKIRKIQKKKWKKSRFGHTPYKRASYYSLVFMTITVLFSLVTIAIRGESFAIKPPDSAVNKTTLISWVVNSLFIPHILVYTMVFIASLAILSMCDRQYLWWLCKQSFTGSFIHFLIIESLIFAFFAVFINTEPERNFSTLDSDIGSPVQIFLDSFISLTLVIMPWYAYRTAWKAYREIGAQTLSDRWNDYAQQLWFRNSGRTWEKLVERPFIKIFGLDGRKPRKGFFWVILFAPVMISITQAIGMTIGNYSLSGFLSILILPISILFIAARAKVKDGRPDSPRFLDIKRDEDSNDDFSMINNLTIQAV